MCPLVLKEPRPRAELLVCAQSATDFRTGSLDFAFGGPDNRDIFPEGAISGTFWRFQAPNRGLIGPAGARLPAQPQTRAEEYAQQARIRHNRAERAPPQVRSGLAAGGSRIRTFGPAYGNCFGNRLLPLFGVRLYRPDLHIRCKSQPAHAIPRTAAEVTTSAGDPCPLRQVRHRRCGARYAPDG
jgi:hypothetical protein